MLLLILQASVAFEIRLFLHCNYCSIVISEFKDPYHHLFPILRVSTYELSQNISTKMPDTNESFYMGK